MKNKIWTLEEVAACGVAVRQYMSKCYEDAVERRDEGLPDVEYDALAEQDIHFADMAFSVREMHTFTEFDENELCYKIQAISEDIENMAHDLGWY